MNEHAEWCHVVTGCIEPSHCTCDYAAPGCGFLDEPERNSRERHVV